MQLEGGVLITDQADLEDLLRPQVQWPQNIKYAPLTSSTQTRVLRVHYDVSLRRLQGTIEVIDLSNSPQYDALSYYWGHPNGRRKIICIDGEVVLIGASLYSFLRRFGMEQRGHIWVDALCINQSDLQERNQQVMMMDKIYRRAREVCIWLGKGDSGTDFALRCCQRWHLIKQLEEADRTQLIKRIASSLPHVATRAYWNRVWIVQEVALASHRRLICGDMTISLERFYTFLKDVVEATRDANTTDTASKDEKTPTISQPLSTLIQVLENIEQTRQKPQLLLRAASAFATHQCTDPSDKLYGMRSLAENGHLMVVDYTKPFLDVLLDALETEWQCLPDEPLKHDSRDVSGSQTTALNWLSHISWARAILKGSDVGLKNYLSPQSLNVNFGNYPVPFDVGAPSKLTTEDFLRGRFFYINWNTKPQPGDICINLSITHDSRYFPLLYCYLILRSSSSAENSHMDIVGIWQVPADRELGYFEQHLIHLIISRELQFCQTNVLSELVLSELRPSHTTFNSVYNRCSWNFHASRRAVLVYLMGRDMMPAYGEQLIRAWWLSGAPSKSTPDFCQCKNRGQ